MIMIWHSYTGPATLALWRCCVSVLFGIITTLDASPRLRPALVGLKSCSCRGWDPFLWVEGHTMASESPDSDYVHKLDESHEVMDASPTGIFSRNRLISLKLYNTEGTTGVRCYLKGRWALTQTRTQGDQSSRLSHCDAHVKQHNKAKEKRR